jgi:hypothetical protein
MPGTWNCPGSGGVHSTRSRSSCTSRLPPLGRDGDGARGEPPAALADDDRHRDEARRARRRGPGMKPSAMCCTTSTAWWRSAGSCRAGSAGLRAAGGGADGDQRDLPRRRGLERRGAAAVSGRRTPPAEGGEPRRPCPACAAAAGWVMTRTREATRSLRRSTAAYSSRVPVSSGRAWPARRPRRRRAPRAAFSLLAPGDEGAVDEDRRRDCALMIRSMASMPLITGRSRSMRTTPA